MIVRIVSEYIAVLPTENYITPMIVSDHSSSVRCVVSDILYKGLMRNCVNFVKQHLLLYLSRYWIFPGT